MRLYNFCKVELKLISIVLIVVLLSPYAISVVKAYPVAIKQNVRIIKCIAIFAS